jgi:chemotaxis regulatin CheY-phosphate phosphatase CheZ
LLALRYRIVEVEKAAGRVVTMAAEAGQPDVDEVRASVRDVHERLDRLEDARRELRDHGTG